MIGTQGEVGGRAFADARIVVVIPVDDHIGRAQVKKVEAALPVGCGLGTLGIIAPQADAVELFHEQLGAVERRHRETEQFFPDFFLEFDRPGIVARIDKASRGDRLRIVVLPFEAVVGGVDVCGIELEVEPVDVDVLGNVELVVAHDQRGVAHHAQVNPLDGGILAPDDGIRRGGDRHQALGIEIGADVADRHAAGDAALQVVGCPHPLQGQVEGGCLYGNILAGRDQRGSQGVVGMDARSQAASGKQGQAQEYPSVFHLLLFSKSS